MSTPNPDTTRSSLEKGLPIDAMTTSVDTTAESSIAEKDISSQDAEFPEGGARAWAVAIGSALVMFATFGYANAFGYVSTLISRQSQH